MMTDPTTLPEARSDALGRWYHQWPGQLVSKAECKLLADLTARLFGYQLVQLGTLGPGQDYLAACPVRAHTVVDVSNGLPGMAPGASLMARPEALPVASDSIDAVLMLHTLDFAADPHQVLREAERVLVPEGRLVISGFNPWSLWGLWRGLQRPFPRRRSQFPWCGHFLSYPRLQDWLTLMGFDIERTDVRVFRPPLKRAATLTRLAFLERLGERYWPMLAGVYVVQAVKRVSTLRPIGPAFKRAPALGARAIEPSARGVPRV